MNVHRKLWYETSVPDAADCRENMAEDDEEWEFANVGCSLIMLPNELASEVGALIAKFDDERETAESARAEERRKYRAEWLAALTNEYPEGWDEKRVRAIIDHYDNLTEDEWLAESEAAFNDPTETAMTVPRELVPEVMALIAKFDDEREAAESARAAE